jgi:YD repeat-containing protein
VADTSKPGYLFDYDETVALPAKNSRSVDFWGYYNGSPNTTLIPDLDFFDYTHDAAFVTDSGVPIFDYNPSYKANRYPNNTYAKAYLLKKVTYPTGGYTQYEFEPHTFDNQFIPNQQQLTAMQQTPSCNTGPYYTWTQNWPLSIHENTTLPMTISFTHGSPVGTYADNDKSAMYNSTISYVRISKTLNGVVTQLKTWTAAYNLTTYAQFNTNGGTNIFENFNIVYEAGATYKLEVSCPVLQSTTFGAPTQAVGVHATTVYYDKLAIPQISQQQGFRIKSIKSYSSLNVLAYNKQYSYTGGKLLNTFLPLKWSGTAYHFGWDGVNYTTHFNKRVSLCTEYFSSPGNPVGYDMVEEVTCDKNNLATNGKKQYYFQNVMNIGTTGLPTALNFHNGTLDKEQTYNKDGVLQEEKIQSYIYLPFTDPNFTCITIENHQFGGVDGPPSSSFQSGQPYINYKFSYNSYPLLCDWYMLGSTLTNQYLDGNTLSSLTTYEYNSTGQQKSVITATSLQEQEKISMAYADDYPYGDAIEQTMIDNHMINIPIRTQEIKNSVTLSTTKNGFIKDATTVNNILLKYIYTLKDATGGSLEKRVTYDLYDSRGNLLQYHLENGINVSIIWGYNQTLPVAKLENVAYASISTTTLSTIASQSTPSPAAVPNETNLLSTLNGLRTTFPAAMITTYTYKPGVGVQTITDPKGDKITYTYDAFGRLLNVKDKNNNILSENEYHFKP